MVKPICPTCYHEETFRAFQNGYEPCRDEIQTMKWNPPFGGARGQQCTPWDNGGWSCDVCGTRLPPQCAMILIDAVLRVTDPDGECDSYDGETYQDAREADMSRSPK